MTCSSQICSKLPDGSGPSKEQHSKQKVHNNMYPVKNQKQGLYSSLHCFKSLGKQIDTQHTLTIVLILNAQLAKCFSYRMSIYKTTYYYDVSLTSVRSMLRNEVPCNRWHLGYYIRHCPDGGCNKEKANNDYQTFNWDPWTIY